jgi:MFS family permease
MFMQTLAIGILLPVLVPYTRQVLHLNQYQYSLTLMAAGSFTLILLFPFGYLADRWGHLHFLIFGFCLMALAIGLIVTTVNYTLILSFACLLGIGYAAVIPAWNALLSKTIPDQLRGTLFGFVSGIEDLGFTAGPVIGGQAWTLFGPKGPFFITVVILIVVALFYLLCPKDKIFVKGS